MVRQGPEELAARAHAEKQRRRRRPGDAAAAAAAAAGDEERFPGLIPIALAENASCEGEASLV